MIPIEDLTDATLAIEDTIEDIEDNDGEDEEEDDETDDTDDDEDALLLLQNLGLQSLQSKTKR